MHRRHQRCLFSAAVCLMSAMSLRPSHAEETLTVLRTSGGREFGVLGEKPRSPAPTLFVFAHAYAGTLQSDDYNKAGRLLAKQGVLCVSLDLPCHGGDRRAGEPEGIAGWRARLEQGEQPIGRFCKEAGTVLDHLIAEGYTDPDRVAACGTSRGGFVALHFAAAQPRVRCVAAFAPVTDLLLLSEFQGMSPTDPAAALRVSHHAEALFARPVWLIIGNHDERVGTDSVITLARTINKAAVAHEKLALVDLHVQPAEGHRTPASGHPDAAVWLGRQLQLPAQP
ncbi:MAG: hypothetical protein EXS05_14520 [Planctomycetaceae bacterium]|nr:hypothetical protein [Planctomycetaceae bacterium]